MNKKLQQIVIFLGAPGSGKGTLSRLCEDRLGWKQLSTGDLCRHHIEHGTQLGKEIDLCIKSGKLVADSLIIEMVVQWLEEHAREYQTVILDGFPRTRVQAESFLNLTKTAFPDVALKVYQLIVPDQEIIERISTRVVCSNSNCQAIYSERKLGADWDDKRCVRCESSLIKRSDDAPEKIAVRLDNYYQHVKNLLDVYKEANIEIISIAASGSSERVFQAVNDHERMDA